MSLLSLPKWTTSRQNGLRWRSRGSWVRTRIN